MTTTIPAGWKLLAKKTCYVLMHDGAVIATLAGPESKANAAIIARMLAAPGVSTVQDKPAAYLTLDEDGSPCMLFFDVVEARTYCALGEVPEALYRHPAPAAGDALDVLLLTQALQGLRHAFVIAVGDKSPFARMALEKADAALAAAQRKGGA